MLGSGTNNLPTFSPALLNRARRKEATLAAEFGEQWQTYCKRVPMLLPRLSRGENP
jgi:protein-S-isoprenylcysteine O-methyltransferase Ste14